MLDTLIPALSFAQTYLWLCALVPVLVRFFRCSLRRIRADWLIHTPDFRKCTLQRALAPSTACTRAILGQSKRYTVMVLRVWREAPYLAVAVIPDLWKEDPRRA